MYSTRFWTTPELDRGSFRKLYKDKGPWIWTKKTKNLTIRPKSENTLFLSLLPTPLTSLKPDLIELITSLYHQPTDHSSDCSNFRISKQLIKWSYQMFGVCTFPEGNLVLWKDLTIRTHGSCCSRAVIKCISILIMFCSLERSPPLLTLVLRGELIHKGDDEVFNQSQVAFYSQIHRNTPYFHNVNSGIPIQWIIWVPIAYLIIQTKNCCHRLSGMITEATTGIWC